MTLHAAIQHVLEGQGRALTLAEIAMAINDRGLYRRQDGQPVLPGQVAARVRNYDQLFRRVDDAVALIASPEAEAEAAPVRIPAPESVALADLGAVGSTLLDDDSFRSASDIDQLVPDNYGLYAIRLRTGATLPDPFGAVAKERGPRLIYLGEAQKQTLLARLVGNELRAKGNGTFFRSLGAVLGYRPVPGRRGDGAVRTRNREAGVRRSIASRWGDRARSGPTDAEYTVTHIATAIAFAAVAIVSLSACTALDTDTRKETGSTSPHAVEVSETPEAGDLEEAYRILEAGYTSWGYWADGGRVDLTAKLLLTDSVLDIACKDLAGFEVGFTPAFVASFNAANPDVHEPSWANPDLVESKVSPVIMDVLTAACPS